MNPDPSAPDRVRAYLAELDRALASCDAALIHDALADAEEHLRQAVAAGASPEEAIRRYGPAQEVADAYLGMADGVRRGASPGTPAEPPRGPEGAAPAMPGAATAQKSGRLRNLPFIGIWFDPHGWGALGLMLFGGLFAWVAFLWVVGVGALSLLLLPLVVGIPLFVVLLGGARGLSLVWGRLIAFLTGVRMPQRAHYVDTAGAPGFFRRIGCWLTDGRSWLSAMFFVGNLPVMFVLGAVFWCGVEFSGNMAGRAVFGQPPAMKQVGGGLKVEREETRDSQGSGFNYSFKRKWSYTPPRYEPDPSAKAPDSPWWARLGWVLFSALLGTCLLWAAKGTAWCYAQIVKAIQVARPTAGR